MCMCMCKCIYVGSVKIECCANVMVLVQNDNPLCGPQLVQQNLYQNKQQDQKPRFLDLRSCVHPSGSVFHTLLLVCSHMSVARMIDCQLRCFCAGNLRCRVYFTFCLSCSPCAYMFSMRWSDAINPRLTLATSCCRNKNPNLQEHH
jgi:hypothetical protein